MNARIALSLEPWPLTPARPRRRRTFCVSLAVAMLIHSGVIFALSLGNAPARPSLFPAGQFLEVDLSLQDGQGGGEAGAAPAGSPGRAGEAPVAGGPVAAPEDAVPASAREAEPTATAGALESAPERVLPPAAPEPELFAAGKKPEQEAKEASPAVTQERARPKTAAGRAAGRPAKPAFPSRAAALNAALPATAKTPSSAIAGQAASLADSPGAGGAGGRGLIAGPSTPQGNGAGDKARPKGGAYSPKPAYPPLARQRGQEGEAIIRVRVDASGQVVAIFVEKSSGYPLLDDAALKGVTHWRFEPATRNGMAVADEVLVPVLFRLR